MPRNNIDVNDILDDIGRHPKDSFDPNTYDEEVDEEVLRDLPDFDDYDEHDRDLGDKDE